MSSLTLLRQFVMSTLVVLLCCGAVSAAVIDDLYDAKVAVNNQAESTQNQAMKDALKRVFVKVSGSDTVVNDGRIKKYINKAATLIRSYTYERRENQLYLVVNFDENKIQEALRSAEFPVWDKRRPDTLVWLAIENEQKEKQVITFENSTDFIQRLKEQAQDRGIQIVLPLWDLNDLQTVSVYDIWGGFGQQISMASERYDLKTIITARIYQQPPESEEAQEGVQQWFADWTFIDNGITSVGRLKNHDVNALANDIINLIAVQLSEKYAISLQNRLLNAVTTQVTVNNIDSIGDYAAVLTFFNSLSLVSTATLTMQQGQQATFELVLLGNEQDLRNSFALDNKLTPVTKGLVDQQQNTLEFMWTD